jgi:penicillin-binding protein 1A
MNLPSINSLLQKINTTLLLERPWFKKVIRIIWILFFAFVVGLPLYIYLVIENPYDLFGDMPSLQAMENPENDLSSEVITADGVSLGRYFRYNRSQVTYDELPLSLVKTLLISEDHRFHEHSGMDFWSYMRVVKGIITLDAQGGGSTLTQQTAKNLFSTRGEELRGKLGKLASPLDLLISKTKEWIIAVKLERNFTKEEIIALYLNTVPFNNNAYGIKIAAETYFNKPLKNIKLHEAALLVGMLQGTYRFNPIEYPERALKKRNDVLNKLSAHHYIAQKTCDSLKTLPLQLKFSIQNQNQGIATYFRSVLKSELLTWCKEHDYDLYESGLKIYTTIDSRMQRFAEEAMREQMKKIQKDFDREWGNKNPWVDDNNVEIVDFLQRKIRRTNTYRNLIKHFSEDSDSINIMLNKKKRMRIFTWNGDRDTMFSSMDSLRYYNRLLQSGLLSMDPSNGEVKAWVGGINHKFFKYDHVHQSKRQAGSTFKPFVYGRAMEDGYSPCYQLLDISPTININGTPYHPANSGGGYGDGTSYTLRQALARSLNSITIQLMEKLKPENVAAFANRVGINSALDPVYSLGLGTSNVSLEELVASYSGFINLGVHNDPYYLTRIEDKDGNVITNFIPRSKQVMNQETAYKIIYLLKGSVEEVGGTSGSLSSAVLENNEVGGKTGTTDNASDGWYIGVTHNLVTGVWVGGDEPSIHFPSWRFGSGGRTAMPMWDKYMQKIYAHASVGFTKGSFRQPDEPVTIRDCSEYNVPPDSVENNFDIP